MIHEITHVGSIPLMTKYGAKNRLGDVMCLPTIMKNLASIGQTVDQDMQVPFNKNGCFIHEFKGSRQGRLISKARRKVGYSHSK